MTNLTQTRLQMLLDYNPNTGIFVWRVPRRPHIKVGDVAGSKTARRYIDIYVDKKPYKAHRLAWLYMHGKWPDSEIDHINRDRYDNRIANLREVTRSANMQNTVRKPNASGFRGVGWHKHQKAWRARISVNGKTKNLGYFSTPEEAAEAYLKASITLHLFKVD